MQQLLQGVVQLGAADLQEQGAYPLVEVPEVVLALVKTPALYQEVA